MSTKQESKTTVSHLPEHGPIDENGREILLQVKNVDITFGKGDDAVKAVKNASFDIYKGETFSLVGESGSGKTTIGRAVIRVNPCSAGEILYKGVKISGKIPHSLDREVIRNIQMIEDLSCFPMPARLHRIRGSLQLPSVRERGRPCEKGREHDQRSWSSAGAPDPLPT